MKSHTLSLEDAVIAREGAALTRPFSLSVVSGEMLAIYGNNGSGKSTLLKSIAGLIPLHAGRVLWDGGWPMVPAPTYLGHKRGLMAGMSVMDNVAFWARASGSPELISVALHYFDLDDILEVTIDTLSAGWQQRVALTRLITVPSALWLLDEPTDNLDADGVALVQSLIQTRLEQAGVVVIATHAQLQGERVKSININGINVNPNVDVDA